MVVGAFVACSHTPSLEQLLIVGKQFFIAKHISRVFDRIEISTKADGMRHFLHRGKHFHNLNDGIVFTPDDEPYWAERGTLLKWKWLEDNTIDFAIDNECLDNVKWGK